jgi:transcriptional regulator with XRE-family HTH domain
MKVGDIMERLKIIRKKKGFTQKKVAESLNVTQSTYSKYERGLVAPDPETIVKLSKVFNVSSDYLLGMIDAPFSPDEVNFMRKIYAEKDLDKLTDEFEIYGDDPDKLVTRKELNKIIKRIKELDQVVHGDHFLKKK